jgi:hypothetical protein
MSNDEKIIYTYEKHKPIKMKYIPWPQCCYCGLIYLNNKFTKWCISKGCSNEYHPDYKNILKKYTKRS